jgi:NAD+ synthetase
MLTISDVFSDYNDRGNSFALSEWFWRSFDRATQRGDISLHNQQQLVDGLVHQLKQYASTQGINRAVVGISGGLDSAVTLNLLLQAGWDVIPMILPIHQNPAEIGRAFAVCEQAGVTPEFVDLSAAYDQLIRYPVFQDVNPELYSQASSAHQARVRGGNIRARLRMITLYHTASKHRGLVVSTDNFSELAAGFWTLHGDVGDLAPIQSLTKSWEVPALAWYLGVPKSVISANPTDGLGISTGDETQLGYSYAQADLVALDLMHNQLDTTGASTQDLQIIQAVKTRIAQTRFKRNNPAFCAHPISDNWRYQQLSELENTLVSNPDHTMKNTPEVKNV